MKLDDLFYFYTVSKVHSTSIAAEQLHISQPAISLAIKRLEQELGVILFNRLYRGVSLTPVGEEICALVPKYKAIDSNKCDIAQPTIIKINTQNMLATTFPDEVIATSCRNGVLIQLLTQFSLIENLTMALPYAENDFTLFYLNSKDYNLMEIPDDFAVNIISTSKLYFIVNKYHPDFENVNAVSYEDIINFPLIFPYNINNINDNMSVKVFEQLLLHGQPNIIMYCETIQKIYSIVSNTNYGSIAFKSFIDPHTEKLAIKYIPIKDDRKFLIAALYKKNHPNIAAIQSILSQLSKHV